MREQLAATVGPVFFSDLRPHLARGAVITVDAQLDLVDVGVAVAQDDKDRVAKWIDEAKLRKPTLAELAKWEKVTDARWISLVVAPYVLVQEIVPPEERAN